MSPDHAMMWTPSLGMVDLNAQHPAVPESALRLSLRADGDVQVLQPEAGPAPPRRREWMTVPGGASVVKRLR